METPVYVFTGFLDAGKTSFINDTLQSDSFAKRNDKILIILCEEGEEELKPDTFACKNVDIEVLESKSMLNPDKFEALRRKHGSNLVMLEYNGMWRMPELYDALPNDWQIVDIMAFFDASSFDMYYNNMRDMFTDKVLDSGFIVFNRMDKDANDEEKFHKAVRASNTFGKIAFEYADGSYALDDIEDPLPFDKEADSFEVGIMDYGKWYRDLSENTSDYDGKTITFTGYTQKMKGIGRQPGFVVGRQVMTCCEADAQFCGLYCENGEKDIPFNSWIKITATLNIKNCKLYGRVGPVLTMVSFEKTEQPANPISTFV